jgi:hypothetical protein
MRACIWIWLLVIGTALPGCQNAPAQPSGTMPPVPEAATEFSGDTAFEHLRALTALGPRVAGTPEAAQTRAYLRGELEKLGLGVEERRFQGPPGPDGVPQELVNLVAVIPGASPQLFVLTAAYDTRPFDSFRFVGANDGASAPALLLELARVIHAHPLPYTTWIVFLDREAPRAGDPTGDPLLAGSSVLAAELLSGTDPAPLRMLVSFQQVGDADLRIARDLRSHRLFREEFWLAAARLGRSHAFRPGDRFESPPGSHLPFVAMGFRGVVLISDPSFGGDEPPGAFANSEDDTSERCSPQSLATVGMVTVEALQQIGERLAKIDRYATKSAAPPESKPVESAPTEPGSVTAPEVTAPAVTPPQELAPAPPPAVTAPEEPAPAPPAPPPPAP